MIAFYDITEKLYNHLIADNDINTVKIGNSINEVDFNKQTIFPFAHILVSSGQFINGTIKFSVTVSCIDIVDITKKDIRNENEVWKGIDNEQDVLNTMFAVLENLDKSLRIGSLSDFDWDVDDNVTAERVQDQFKSLAIGWQATFDITIPNRVQNCV